MRIIADFCKELKPINLNQNVNNQEITLVVTIVTQSL